MARHKDMLWNLPEGKPADGNLSVTTHQWDSIHAALLMDIRDELQRLNLAIYCAHFVAIPRTLTRIARNTAKRKRRPAPPTAPPARQRRGGARRE